MSLQVLPENHKEDKKICKVQGKKQKASKHLQYFLAYQNEIQQNTYESNWWATFLYGYLHATSNIAKYKQILQPFWNEKQNETKTNKQKTQTMKKPTKINLTILKDNQGSIFRKMAGIKRLFDTFHEQLAEKFIETFMEIDNQVQEETLFPCQTR